MNGEKQVPNKWTILTLILLREFKDVLYIGKQGHKHLVILLVKDALERFQLLIIRDGVCCKQASFGIHKSPALHIEYCLQLQHNETCGSYMKLCSNRTSIWFLIYLLYVMLMKGRIKLQWQCGIVQNMIDPIDRLFLCLLIYGSL